MSDENKNPVQSNNEIEDFKYRLRKNDNYCRKFIYGNQEREYKGNEYVYVGEKRPTAIAAMLVGYCDDNLENFIAMTEVARESFSDLKNSDVTCSKVTRSSYMKGFTVILFSVPNKAVEGWHYDQGCIDFNF